MLRHPPVSLKRLDQGGLLTANKGAGTLENRKFYAKQTLPAFTQKPKFLCLADSSRDPFYCKRILGPDIGNRLCCADSIGTDGHALKDLMGIALKYCPVHVSARVPFVCIADHKFFQALGVFCQTPFSAGQKPCASSSPEPRVFYFLYNFIL